MTADVAMKKKIDCIQSEKRPGRQSQRQRQRRRGDEPYHERAPVRASRVPRETNAVGADAEEHHMREQQDARIAINRS